MTCIVAGSASACVASWHRPLLAQPPNALPGERRECHPSVLRSNTPSSLLPRSPIPAGPPLPQAALATGAPTAAELERQLVAQRERLAVKQRGVDIAIMMDLTWSMVRWLTI